MPVSIEITRKYLDSGVLTQSLDDESFKKDRCWDGNDMHRFTTLTASVMTLGCVLPPKMWISIEKTQPSAYQEHVKTIDPSQALTPLARAPMKKVFANYKVGVPYDFGNKTFLDNLVGNVLPGLVASTEDVGGLKSFESTLSGGNPVASMLGPPSDEEMGLTPIYSNAICATCGAANKGDGSKLDSCGGCGPRKYCSKQCQKKHWKFHKGICKQPKERMDQFVESVPQIFVADCERVKKVDEKIKEAKNKEKDKKKETAGA